MKTKDSLTYLAVILLAFLVAAASNLWPYPFKWLLFLCSLIIIFTTIKNIYFGIYLMIFFSMTLPRTGPRIAGAPLSIANMLLAITFFSWVLRKFADGKITVMHTSLNKYIFLFTFFGLYGVVLGISMGFRLENIAVEFLSLVGYSAVFFLLTSLVNSAKRIRIILGIILFSNFLVAFYGILQFAFGAERVNIPGLLYPSDYPVFSNPQLTLLFGRVHRVFSTFVVSNILGAYLVLFMPLAISLYGSSSRRSCKCALFLLILMELACLLLTFSRGAWLGLTLAMFIFHKFIKKKSIFVLMAFVFIAFIFYEPLRTRLITSSAAKDASVISRLRDYSDTLVASVSYPFGYGLGGGASVDAEKNIKLFSLELKSHIIARGTSLYSHVLEKMGFLALIALFMLLARIYRDAKRYLDLKGINADKFLRSIVLGSLVGLTGVFIHLSFDQFIITSPHTSENIWIMISLIYIIIYHSIPQEAMQKESFSKHSYRNEI